MSSTNSNDKETFVAVPKRLFYKLNKLVANKTISNRDYRVLLVIVDLIYWNVDRYGKPSSRSGATRRITYGLSYADIEEKLCSRGNLTRSIKKLVDLGIIQTTKPESNRQKVVYHLQPDPDKWNVSEGGEFSAPEGSPSEDIPSPPPREENPLQVNLEVLATDDEDDDIVKELEEM